MKKCSKIGCNEKCYVKTLCKKHYHAKYYQDNREKLLSREIARYANNPDPAKARSKAWSKENFERKKKRDSEYAKANREKYNAHARKSYDKNRDKLLAQRAALRKEKNIEFKARDLAKRIANKEKYNATLRAWKERNVEKVRSDGARRRANKMNATPAWANEFFIQEAYSLARLRTKMLGFKWHVDHIIPLRSKIVCGLHCEANLQVIPASVNQSKNNRHWPDMP